MLVVFALVLVIILIVYLLGGLPQLSPAGSPLRRRSRFQVEHLRGLDLLLSLYLCACRRRRSPLRVGVEHLREGSIPKNRFTDDRNSFWIYDLI